MAAIKRLERLDSAVVADSHEAVRLDVTFSDGTSGAMELLAEHIPGAIRAALNVSAKVAELKRLPRAPAGDGALPTVPLAGEMNVATGSDGGLRFVWRVGVLDLEARLPPDAAATLRALLSSSVP